MNYLEIIGTAVGVAYLYLEYHASIYLWIAGIVMPAIYLFVYYRAGLYADFGINVYYLAAAVYGLYCWTRTPPSATAAPTGVITPRHTPAQTYAPLGAAFAVLLLTIASVLIRFTDSNVPWLDSFTTALSVVGLWMLARKYAEQWLVWILVDAVSCGLYIYKELYFTAALYGGYAVIAIFGYRKWIQLMHRTL